MSDPYKHGRAFDRTRNEFSKTDVEDRVCEVTGTQSSPPHLMSLHP